MTIRRSLAFALAAGIGGVLIGRTTVTRDAPRLQVKVPHLPSTAPLAGRECKLERAELAATKAQLANCMADTPQPAEADAPTAVETAAEAEANRVRRNHEVLRTHTEVVIVRRADHTVSVYPPNEPIPDGVIVARRLPSGEIGWYAGPDAGPRSDPAAFRPAPPGSPLASPLIFERDTDGTIMVNGEPAAPSVQKMFGGTYKEDPEEFDPSDPEHGRP
jgi:hypothetical protein